VGLLPPLALIASVTLGLERQALIRDSHTILTSMAFQYPLKSPCAPDSTLDTLADAHEDNTKITANKTNNFLILISPIVN
jgi:hypothetical protein